MKRNMLIYGLLTVLFVTIYVNLVTGVVAPKIKEYIKKQNTLDSLERAKLELEIETLKRKI